MTHVIKVPPLHVFLTQEAVDRIQNYLNWYAHTVHGKQMIAEGKLGQKPDGNWAKIWPDGSFDELKPFSLDDYDTPGNHL